ncbi:MAG: helix-turn-helix domain-containing protein [Blastocatellia bacterium]
MRIREAAEKRKITSSYQLMNLVGVRPSVAAQWWRGDISSLSVASINKLCEALKCKPGDLFEYEPGAPQPD